MSLTQIKAIETAYKGYRFRSRLEARWAVFFDSLEIPWRYEFEGFTLPSGTQYLPDFWLPQQDCFIEIKGDTPTQEEQAKCGGLAELTGKNVYCFFGDICSPSTQNYEDNDGAYVWMYLGHHKGLADEWLVGWDNFHHWCECSKCGFFGIEYSGRSERLDCGCSNPRKDEIYNEFTPRLEAAYATARAARFEFGEGI